MAERILKAVTTWHIDDYGRGIISIEPPRIESFPGDQIINVSVSRIMDSIREVRNTCSSCGQRGLRCTGFSGGIDKRQAIFVISDLDLTSATRIINSNAECKPQPEDNESRRKYAALLIDMEGLWKFMMGIK
jgi:hypothetical protein